MELGTAGVAHIGLDVQVDGRVLLWEKRDLE